MIINGYNCLFLINHLYYYYLNNDLTNDDIKGLIIAKLSETDNRLNDGSIEIIQSLNLLITINGLVNGFSNKNIVIIIFL